MSEKKYGLYMVLPQDIGAEETHFLITPKYTLLYTCHTPPGRHKKLDHVKKLPPLAKQWLNDTIGEIQKAYMEKHQKDLLQYAKSFHEHFSQELQKERQQIEAEDVDGEGTAEKRGSV